MRSGLQEQKLIRWAVLAAVEKKPGADTQTAWGDSTIEKPSRFRFSGRGPIGMIDRRSQGG